MTTKLDDQIKALVNSDKAPPVPTIEKIEEETKRDEVALEKEKKHTVHQAWKWVLDCRRETVHHDYWIFINPRWVHGKISSKICLISRKSCQND